MMYSKRGSTLTSAKIVPTTLHVQSHGRDCNSFTVVGKAAGDEWGTTMIDHDGYVLGGLCMGPQGSDDVEFSVDIETGKIIGWDAEAVKARIAELVETGDYEEDE